jgi:epoxyqueuosine reductase
LNSERNQPGINQGDEDLGPEDTDTQTRTTRLRDALIAEGACLVGFADVSGLQTDLVKGFPFGVCFAQAYDRKVINRLPEDVPFLEMNTCLGHSAKRLYDVAARFLEGWGYRWRRATSATPRGELETELPQKTLATLSAFGWIGKSSLLVTPQYGPRVRIGAILTDCPLEVAAPVISSQCEGCTACVDACPVGAIRGAPWSQGIPRDNLLDVSACHRYLCRDKETLGRRQTCGFCLKACPIGRRA